MLTNNFFYPNFLESDNLSMEGEVIVYYINHQNFIITVSYTLPEQIWGLLLNVIGWFIKLSVKTCVSSLRMYINFSAIVLSH